MRSAKRVGRIIGILLLAQLIVITAGFALLVPVTTPSFLQDAPANVVQIRAAVLLLTACSGITIGVAALGFPFFRQHDHVMALWLLALSVIWFSMQAIDNVHILSMLALSEQYARDGSPGSDLYAILGTAVRSARRFSHGTGLLAIDAWFLAFLVLLFRSSLVPRALAGFGFAMAAIHLTGVALPPFAGYGSVPVLGYALALSYLAIVTWLVAKGFEGAHSSARIPGASQESADVAPS